MHTSEMALCRNRKLDGDALEPDMFTQIAGLYGAGVPDLHRRDVGADRADVVGDRFGKQRPRFIGGAHDGGVRQIGRPILPGGAVDHDTVPGTVGGHHRRAGNSDFLLFERRGHSAASNSWVITLLRFESRHGAECATTSPMMRMAGPPSICSTSAGNSSSVPTAAWGPRPVTPAKTPTRGFGPGAPGGEPRRTDCAAPLPLY